MRSEWPLTERVDVLVVGAGPAGLAVARETAASGLTTLVISVLANSDGSLKQMAIGEAPIAGLTALDRELAKVIGDPGAGFDQVIVQVDSRLHYGPLMQVIDVCTRQKLASGEPLSKLSFVEMPVGG